MLLWNIHLQVLVWTDNFFFLFFFFLRRVPGVKWLSHVIRVCLPTDTFFQSSWNDFLFSFWLGWVFVAVHGLSLAAVIRGYSSLSCAGLSLRWLLLLLSMGYRARAPVVAVLSCLMACWIFPDQGWNPCPCISRQIPNYWTTMGIKVLLSTFIPTIYFKHACSAYVQLGYVGVGRLGMALYCCSLLTPVFYLLQ